MCKIWNKKEVEFLKKNYPHLILSEIAKQLNKTYKSVYSKAEQIGLTKQIPKDRSKSLKQYYSLYNHHMKGKPKSIAQRKKISIARKEWYKKQGGFPEEIKKKISETKKKKYASGELVGWNKGKKRPPFSKKWRENLSKSLIGRKPSINTINAVILRNKTNNPMWDPEIVKKATKNRNYREIARKMNKTKRERGVYLEYSKRMKKNNPMKDPEINKKVNQNPVYMQKRIMSLIKKPNKKEQILIRLFKRYKLPYVYTGKGNKIIGTKNPDFIDEKHKKIVELFGSYWHTKKARCYEETEKGRIEYFKKFGYNTLVIWEGELRNLNLVLEKIKSF